jgi:hypothetical protein
MEITLKTHQVSDEKLILGNLSPTIYVSLETTQSGRMFCWLEALPSVDKPSKHLSICIASVSDLQRFFSSPLFLNALYVSVVSILLHLPELFLTASVERQDFTSSIKMHKRADPPHTHLRQKWEWHQGSF